MSSNSNTEHRLTTVEIKVLEHCSDIKLIRDDIHRLEDTLKFDIRTNHDLIVKILENEIPHLQQDIESVHNGHIHPLQAKWDVLKIVGAVAGILSGLVLILTNLGVIGQLIHGFLSIFFG